MAATASFLCAKFRCTCRPDIPDRCSSCSRDQVGSLRSPKLDLPCALVRCSSPLGCLIQCHARASPLFRESKGVMTDATSRTLEQALETVAAYRRTNRNIWNWHRLALNRLRYRTSDKMRDSELMRQRQHAQRCRSRRGVRRQPWQRRCIR